MLLNNSESNQIELAFSRTSMCYKCYWQTECAFVVMCLFTATVFFQRSLKNCREDQEETNGAGQFVMSIGVT